MLSIGRPRPNGNRNWVSLLAVAAAALALVSAVQDDPMILHEISASDMPEPGMQPFVDKYMEPGGAACMAYVREGSANHKLMKKLASATSTSDLQLYELRLPMGAVLNYEEEETLIIVKRQYAKNIWTLTNQSGLDEDPIVFGGPKPWKKKQVREWMMENAYPTFNYRLMQGAGSVARFPWYKYFGSPNTKGVGLVALNLTDRDWEKWQGRSVSQLRLYINELLGKFRFTVMEKSEFTLPARQASKLGLDPNIQQELILIEDPATVVPKVKVDNFWHGNPKKYRLTNFSKDGIRAFFNDYAAGKLPTYWASRELVDERSQVGVACLHLTSDTFQEKILNADQESGAFVAFFNMDREEGCEECAGRLTIWRKVAEELRKRHGSKLLKTVLFGALDQSDNEHPERKVGGRLSEPVIMWYPPGSQKERWRERMFMHDMALDFTEEGLAKNIMEFVADQFDAELSEL